MKQDVMNGSDQKVLAKLPKYKELAEYLGVSEQAVKQYPKVKRDLMLHGLKAKTLWIDNPSIAKPIKVYKH